MTTLKITYLQQHDGNLLFDCFNKLKRVKVVVFGDLMLDRYTFGKAQRVSPEAPVLVLHGQDSDELPGGAGNVALNLASLGAHVEIVSRVGKDADGKQLVRLLKRAGVGTGHLIVQKEYPTTLKHRVIADSHHLLRIDTESIESLELDLEETLITMIPEMIASADIIAISDYGKGFLSRELLSCVIHAGNKAHIPVLVDPKGDDFTKYAHATLIKPNMKEAYIAAKRSETVPIEMVGAFLVNQTEAEHVLITRSHEGMSLFSADIEGKNFPIKAQKVSDVTGAGDAVLAMIAIAIASGVSIDDAIALANIAGCIAVSTLGCVQVTLAQVAEKLLQEQLASKVFDEDHLYALQEALKGKSACILAIAEAQEMDADLFTAIQEMENLHGHFVLYMKGRSKNDSLVKLLSSIRAVDFIFLKSANLSCINSCTFFGIHEGELCELVSSSL
jgi:D-glycero-beta-D-manno-heptose-7-phosphate kinase